jgi:hypothetical protein
LKQDAKQELEGKLPPLIPSFFVFFATKKTTTTFLSSTFGLAAVKKVTTTLLSSAFVFGFATTKKAMTSLLLIFFIVAQKATIARLPLPSSFSLVAA